MFADVPDFAGARIYARLVASDDEGVTAYMGWCLYRARQAVMDNWTAIDRFARVLLEKGEMFGGELQAKLAIACRLAKPKNLKAVRCCNRRYQAKLNRTFLPGSREPDSSTRR